MLNKTSDLLCFLILNFVCDILEPHFYGGVNNEQQVFKQN